VPIELAHDARELRAALGLLAECDRVYVDTAGLAGSCDGAREVRSILEHAGEEVGITAVLSAATSEAALRRTWRQLESLTPQSCVLTKLDEGTGGTACSWLAEVGLSAAWLGTGQRVPQDLAPANGRTLARWLMQS
jgi:flagellar biosynthesis protein FlhF